jgi:hypothetical protein
MTNWLVHQWWDWPSKLVLVRESALELVLELEAALALELAQALEAALASAKALALELA